jgi:hypothetical protein
MICTEREETHQSEIVNHEYTLREENYLESLYAYRNARTSNYVLP